MINKRINSRLPPSTPVESSTPQSFIAADQAISSPQSTWPEITPEANLPEAATRQEVVARQEAARRLGQATSERKRAAVRENGKKGGRPRGSRTSGAARARMSAAQRQRRAREQEAQPPENFANANDQ